MWGRDSNDGSIDMANLFTVALDDPQQEGKMPLRYVSYRCTTSRGDVNTTCRHRFSDFSSLRDKLLTAVPGVLIPPIPGKKVVNNFAPELIEHRRDLLEQFLNFCACHPLVHSQVTLTEFLEWGGEYASSTPFEDLVPLPREFTEDNPPCINATQLRSEMGAVRKAVKMKAKNDIKTSQSWEAISTHAKELSENSLNTNLKEPFSNLSDSSASISGVIKTQGDDTLSSSLVKSLKRCKLFCDAIDEQVKGLANIKNTLEKRNGYLLTTRQKLQEVANKPEADTSTTTGKWFSKITKDKDTKQAELAQQAEEIETEITNLKERQTKFLRTLEWEIGRFHVTKTRVLQEGLLSLAQDSKKASMEVHEAWAALSRQLQGSQPAAASAQPEMEFQPAQPVAASPTASPTASSEPEGMGFAEITLAPPDEAFENGGGDEEHPFA